MTEGEKTEPNYLLALARKLGLKKAALDIRSRPSGTDAKSLAEAAREIAQSRAKEAAKQGLPDYDEKFIVFDWEHLHGDNRAKGREALRICAEAKIGIADSDPCFECWLLLHFKRTTMRFENREKAENALKKAWPGYDCSAEFPSDVVDRYQEAMKNAEHCREEHKKGGGKGNPPTNVDRLVEAMASPPEPVEEEAGE